MTFFGFFENILVITPLKKRRLSSSTRPPAASRCCHVPSGQQHYDVPAKERPSMPHLGEGGNWKSPSRGWLAWPPAWPGIVNNCKSRQPESFVTNESAAARLSGVLLNVLLHCRTAVLGRSVGGWVGGWVGGGWVVGGWWMAARSLPEMAEYRQKMKLPPFVSCFIQGPQEPNNCSPRTRCTAVRTAALLYCCM